MCVYTQTHIKTEQMEIDIWSCEYTGQCRGSLEVGLEVRG